MLCGVDPYTGESFEHRRDWVQQRLQFLAGYYGIDVLGYAIMGNHLHVILRNRPDVVETWSDEEVAKRIWYLFPKRKEDDGSAAEPRRHELSMLMASQKKLQAYRSRLSDVSWLMRQLAEKIARMANHEDDCTGRFWEGRFKCQPLLDEAAILACSAYVDLNPVRAGIAQSLETSDYTSAQDRFESEKVRARAKSSAVTAVTAEKPGKQKTDQRGRSEAARDGWLAPVRLNERGRPGPHASRSGLRASDKGFLPMSVKAYLEFVDWTGRQIAKGKRGRIPASCAPILKRLSMKRQTWCDLVKDFGRLFRRVAGRPQSLAQSAESRGMHHRQSSGGAALLSASS
jgi:REP element-mobilizing transposase RayT